MGKPKYIEFESSSKVRLTFLTGIGKHSTDGTSWKCGTCVEIECMGVGTEGAEGAAAPPTFGAGEQAIALAPQKV